MNTSKKSKTSKKRTVPTPRPATPEEIAAEIAELKRLRPLIPTHTMFGDDNIARIDAEIRALEEDMDEGGVMDTWFPYDVGSFPDDEDPDQRADEANVEEGRSYETEAGARAVIDWRNGHSIDKSSSGWVLLIHKKG